MTKKLQFQEGDVFWVPLECDAYIRGVIARMDGEGRAFGFFFGPKMEHYQNVSQIEGLDPSKSSMCCKFGDYGLVHKKWKLVGKIKDWDREMWSCPKLVRKDEDDGVAFICEYDDQLNCVNEIRVPIDHPLVGQLPEDGLFGSSVLEKILSRKFCYTEVE